MVIVGASAAGLFSALHLARSHVPVRVFERATSFAPLARTLIVTPEVTRALGFAPVRATRNRVHTLELCSTHRCVPIELDEPDLIVERAELLQQLMERALDAGAEIEFGHEFTGFADASPSASVVVRERETAAVRHVPARAVIAADGVRSHVARAAGLEPQRAVTVLQARISTPAADPGIGKVWFVPDDSPYFYWLCPESSEAAAVGLVDVNPREARHKLDRFLAARGWQPLEYQAALVPLYTPGKPVSARVDGLDVLLVGDAAGHVKVTTIGGTVSGLLGAEAAARSIACGRAYQQELRSAERELRLHWYMRKLMLRFGDTEYDVLLQLLRGRLRRLLEVHNRDRLNSVFWSMLAVQPRLPLLAAQALWRAGLQP
ncbi:MAG: NAD(P)/FAD-dependent oxidoreductase [Chloroflexi bacterium]|nr:NAD(P)/FAD-dependent oxidoreductase [Chloroflexota bacterium]